MVLFHGVWSLENVMVSTDFLQLNVLEQLFLWEEFHPGNVSGKDVSNRNKNKTGGSFQKKNHTKELPKLYSK